MVTAHTIGSFGTTLASTVFCSWRPIFPSNIRSRVHESGYILQFRQISIASSPESDGRSRRGNSRRTLASDNCSSAHPKQLPSTKENDHIRCSRPHFTRVAQPTRRRRAPRSWPRACAPRLRPLPPQKCSLAAARRNTPHLHPPPPEKRRDRQRFLPPPLQDSHR